MGQHAGNDIPEPVRAAYKVFGLEPEADYGQVRAAFRAKAEAAAPAEGEASPATLKKLQVLLRAHDILKEYAPRATELVLTPEEARKGGLMTIQIEDRSAMVRITPFVKTGSVFVPVNESRWRVRVKVVDPMVDGGQEEGPEERRRREEKARQLEELKARGGAGSDARSLMGMLRRGMAKAGFGGS